jgi:hypothetical protein
MIPDGEEEVPTSSLAAEPKRGAPEGRQELTKTVIVASASVIVAAIGLLGPLTAMITKRYELALDEKKFQAQLAVEAEKNKGAKEIQDGTLKHQTEMDFLGRLIDPQGLQGGEIAGTFYRRDVLRFFQATLQAGPLHDLAQVELGAAEEKIRVFDRLQREKEAALSALESKKSELADTRNQLAGAKAGEAAQLLALQRRLDLARKEVRDAESASPEQHARRLQAEKALREIRE